MRRRAVTLIELLVVIAILGVLFALLLPAVIRSRALARRLADQNNLKQLVLGVNNYESANGHLPPLMTSENGGTRWWFAFEKPMGTFATEGSHLMPYLENNRNALQNPAKAPGNVYLTYAGLTGGYGYNFWYLAPSDPPGVTLTGRYQKVRLATIASTSRTVCFTTAVHAHDTQPELTEIPFSYPPSVQRPTVHHRFFFRTANVGFVDGHVEAITQPTRNPPAASESETLRTIRDREHVYDFGTTDELWDRQ
jgi:prepilin-type N-terminal cleavage/methylation domain-containing protein/prepilin-type processing-associated H-X9-DG protein